MILLIDNYDSFSYNLYQLAGGINSDIKVIRNDELTISEIKALAPTHIILSPGPGHPSKAGVCEQVVQQLGQSIPILGVCLGHQAICEALGGKISHAYELMHGKPSIVDIDTSCRIFKGLSDKERVARYHSLIADKDSLPDCISVTATDEKGEIMAFAHKNLNIYGLQFHPESILTDNGRVMMENFLKI
ncbi:MULTISPECIES: aminodeoxychorismate/anthranilate synthase component II [unclassified Ruminococcus]|uniref:anthranilate synthase component II n=1 Tax=unclassified Ruminococcus TaxID=2608920 RepID=UPI00210A2C06|nr:MULTISPECIES: aminodeoxychorismate/anthranilate synthase component II [unclassified Ruminococcus]MCQ4022753.1 aminodeoxychorismate/anthranilate synthase component II [Ruminococcus sp. zg-924]MCQ4114993.1 aminodeoxychorismate/anthranilate synthase component II [Ruminococcus sp. zg-921]